MELLLSSANKKPWEYLDRKKGCHLGNEPYTLTCPPSLYCSPCTKLGHLWPLGSCTQDSWEEVKVGWGRRMGTVNA